MRKDGAFANNIIDDNHKDIADKLPENVIPV